ncbi:hypothetical protein KSK37_08725 [Kaistella sp. DKR-2]|uniref:hypothetical protein n=1 Tax=Kaistella soli TaxID=2849654 RepID=UPI001C2609E5|nr:hypothetical protein [Kaistella soli]MBU8883164.1 hypothetical protein [Kaistella soli]
MKKIFVISGTFISSVLFSQIIINPDNANPPTNTSVSLEFGSDARGIILPYVEATSATNAVAGTFIMDPSDKEVKFRLADGSWKNLSGSAATTQSVTSMPSQAPENSNAKVVIGSASSVQAQVPGILVLSETNKAMILPKVASPHINVKNPAAGMLVYDSANRMLAVFNGTQWSFWKP